MNQRSRPLRICSVIASLALSAAALAQTTPSPGYTERAVTLVTPSGILYGTELIPAAAASIPVVLIHAGSGPTDRDGNSTLLPGPNDSLKQLAEGLARADVASLRYDKRGIGQSAAAMTSESALRFDDYVDDAAAWIRQLRSDPHVSRIVVAGHSEGSLIGMLAAGQAGADAYVSIAGPARGADETTSAQLAGKLPPALAADNAAILASLKAGKTVAQVPPPLAQFYRPSVQPYLISLFAYDPRKVIATLRMPVLILQGSADIQVPVVAARELAAASPDAKLVVIDGMNHVMKIVGDDAALQQSSYSNREPPVAQRLIEAIAAFAKAN